MTVEPVQFLDLRQSHDHIRSELDDQWRHTVDNNGFIGGEKVDQFERAFADYCGAAYAVGVGNGTDALELILAGLGIGPGDEVIVPANTFIATVEAVVRVGATPVYVDVDPGTLLVTERHVSDAITSKTAALIVVHLYGQMPDMDAMERLTESADIALIEDAAQAHGASWNGRRAGSIGVAGAFSFYPGKNLGALGDGGAVTTNAPELAASIRSIANHGRSEHSKYEHDRIGRNSRLDGLQAALLGVKLPELDTWNKSRRRAAEAYDELLPEFFVPVVQAMETVSAYHLYVVRCVGVSRDEVGLALSEASVGWGIHYPVPCHQQKPYQTADVRRLDTVEDQATQILSLPMHPHLMDGQIERVCDVLRGLG